ncbi:plasmid pRiA4b ORF-3 family protein [Sulfobacillus acidophilus DSM 10332]|uniref:Plasmid pRiA4b ORF-3 family protein n=1 Tax=Sulfobacillus acidophilus (strain ATCC 700253 / DSM 10332 / NAL) TaxID=679936 RepID=G8TU59_SULAD|nr:plasmid pRiA4b ORF-3 family protein [Sulfobacillus acidophilus DSM 10332]
MARISGLSLRVELLDVPDVVYRDLWIPKRLTWHQLHTVLQLALGWENLHRYEFRRGTERIGLPRSSDPHPVTDARTVRLSAYPWLADSQLTYLYDFHDGWRHRITVLNCAVGNRRQPILLDGHGVCPPEDVGGVTGYREFLDAITDPDHEDYALYRLWADGHYAFTGFRLDEAVKLFDQALAPRRRRTRQPTGQTITYPIEA